MKMKESKDSIITDIKKTENVQKKNLKYDI